MYQTELQQYRDKLISLLKGYGCKNAEELVHDDFYLNYIEERMRREANLTQANPKYSVWHIDLKTPFMLEELWVTEDKNIVPIKRLATPHLSNILKYFEKYPEKHERENIVLTKLLDARLKNVQSEYFNRTKTRASEIEGVISSLYEVRWKGDVAKLDEAISILAKLRDEAL